MEKRLNNVDAWVGVTKSGWCVKGQVGVAEFEFRLGLSEMELEVVPSFFVVGHFIPETKIEMENFCLEEDCSGHVDKVLISFESAEGGRHVFELSKEGEHVGERLGVVVGLILSFYSCFVDGIGGDVAVGGEEVSEKIGDAHFKETSSWIDKRCEDVLSKSFEELVEEGAFNVVGFVEGFELGVVDAIVFGDLGGSCFVSMCYRVRLFGTFIRCIGDAGVVGSAVGDATMAVKASTECRRDGACIGEDLLLDDPNFCIVEVSINRGRGFMGK